MARAVHRSGLVALGIATALMASCAFAAKDVVVAVGSNFTTLDPYDANDTLSQAVAKSFYQGLFGLDKEMKLKNVLAESYTVSDDGITYTVKLREGIKFQDGTVDRRNWFVAGNGSDQNAGRLWQTGQRENRHVRCDDLSVSRNETDA